MGCKKVGGCLKKFMKGLVEFCVFISCTTNLICMVGNNLCRPLSALEFFEKVQMKGLSGKLGAPGGLPSVQTFQIRGLSILLHFFGITPS